VEKKERNAEITSDFHSAGKIENRIFSKFAELKNEQTYSNSEKKKINAQLATPCIKNC
tara:strand:- start:814 stop:987 length:174 start_codon:yes stop_codon:yes gene_type:complete